MGSEIPCLILAAIAVVFAIWLTVITRRDYWIQLQEREQQYKEREATFFEQNQQLQRALIAVAGKPQPPMAAPRQAPVPRTPRASAPRPMTEDEAMEAMMRDGLAGNPQASPAAPPS